jgi:hypothetical protein
VFVGLRRIGTPTSYANHQNVLYIREGTESICGYSKRQAVDLVASSGRAIGSVAKELGLRDSVLRRWVECLDDWVGESNPVRAVDVFVDALELRDLGFDGV